MLTLVHLMGPDHNIVTANELARALGVTGLQFRNWLRDRKAAGHPLLAGHIKHQRYGFSDEEAHQLLTEYRASHTRGSRSRTTPAPPYLSSSRSDRADADTKVPPLSEDPGHRVETKWMGKSVVTLEDLLRPGLLAVVVGINPAPLSVAAGHYWQGNTGRTLWRRLRFLGLMPECFEGYEDDAAFEAGVGFTDVVKRPTASADQLSSDELKHGLADLEDKLTKAGVPVIIFAFKGAATALFGDFEGNGFIPDLRVERSDVFVMPGPYEKNERAQATLDTLRHRVVELRFK